MSGRDITSCGTAFAHLVTGACHTSLAPPAFPRQAIDAQVEQLASGAAKAFSSLWGGLSSVARVVAAEVAASVADVQVGPGRGGDSADSTLIVHA